METTFTCYTKKIQGQPFYFVKKFIVLPEYSSVPPVMEAFGMHTDFDKACAIAQLTDASIKKQLLEEVESGLKQAKVIDLAEVNFISQRPAVGL
jgi:hypothetical protein